MKCEKCNEKQASFFYSSNINGEKTERHLCADCAREEGFGGALDYSPMAMFDRAFQSVFEDFFAPAGSRMTSFGSFGLPFGGIMAPVLPRLYVREAAPQPQTQVSGSPIPDDAGQEVRRRRQREALKAQLEAAVQAEDYEQAITLRDKLREMDK